MTSSGAVFVQFEQVIELKLESGGKVEKEFIDKKKGLIDGVCKVAG